MGVTLAEVEVATRIRQKYLSALEAEEWHLLPGEVVGRGFLRNYADYLGLDPNEVMERRRAVVEPNLTAALSTTSAGAPLPPERMVDYRPKEVDLKDETDSIQRGEIRLTPILAIVALAALVGLGWWGITSLSLPVDDLLADAQTRIAALFDRSEPTPASARAGNTPPESLGVLNNENVAGSSEGVTETLPAVVTPGTVVIGSGGDQAPGEAGDEAPAADETGSQAPAGQPPLEEQTGGQTEQPAAEQSGFVLVPTDTPAAVAQAAPPEAPAATPEPPTATPAPPTPEAPTATPEIPTATPLPADTPTPEPPPAPVAANCADVRTAIAGLGAGQVVNGVVGIAGTAQHDNFQFYKLEYAPGANAAGGFVYFDGSNSPVAGGLLGNLDTTTLPNGEYTIRLTVVDQTSNFPPPCDVTIVIQN
jgi:hypothetical protein